MNIFKTYHPIVNFIYFVFVILFSAVCKHPVYVAISFICSLLYLVLLKMKYIKYVILLMAVIGVTYPLFNHGGLTVIFYFPGGNPLTAESVLYAVATAFSVGGTLCWFLCCTRVLTADKLMCVFGKIHPGFSLLISMVISFVPKFVTHLKKTLTAYRGIGRDVSRGNILRRSKIWLSVFSITVTQAIENAIETSDSMKSRGYGTEKRSSFSPYKLKAKDMYMLTAIVILILCIVAASNNGSVYYRYYPLAKFSFNTAHNFALYFIFSALPVLTEIYENAKFKFLISKNKAITD